MPRVDIVAETAISDSARVAQLSGMFDVPPAEKTRVEWHGELPIEAEPWNVGLIVGPSGAGKSTVMRQVFGEPAPLEWGKASVIDDFAARHSIADIAAVCQAVGFNTIPAWMRPFAVLSNGERFRVELARRLLETEGPLVVDEFTSVVDRQVAQIGSHAVQKYIRRNNRQFVAVSCHYDIIDWLQPDWIFEPATMHFARRCLQRRPSLDITISRVPYSAWKLFAPFHYMSAELSKACRCFGLWVNDRLASFAAIGSIAVSSGARRGSAIRTVSRVVTLPDWQGLGLAFVLLDSLGAAWKAVGARLHNYPAHPAFVRASQRSANWRQVKKAGDFSALSTGVDSRGGRPCAVFDYVGEAMPRDAAERLLAVG